jgi:glycosyltransferase involved in cell wall biosynthesis
MRVALLSYNAQASDAIGNHTTELTAFFLDRGTDVRVFVESNQRLHPALQSHCQRLSSAEPKGEAWEFLTSADLILVQYGHYYSLLEFLPLLAAARPRIVFDYHGVTPPELWAAHNREALELGLRRRGLVWCADAAITHSRFTYRELRGPTGFLVERTHVLGHPVDTKRFRPGAPGRSLRETLNLRGAHILLYVGRLAGNKRLPVLVEALADFCDLMPPVHVVIAGDTSDLYAAEAERCRQLAVQHGVAERLHFLGRISEQQLLDAYRSTDIFVMPSRHEGYCIPVIEAMACGVPVIAARAGALPETIAGAGLTFTPDQPDDLARLVRRVLTESSRVRSERPLRVAIVSFRYGADFAGGAEASLRRMAGALHAGGHTVEVYTTCTRSESNWTNELPEGVTICDGIPVHRFRMDPHDRQHHLESVRAILQTDGPVSDATASEYLAHCLHSSRLIEALGATINDVDAILVGPYLYGLTHDVACGFPKKAVLVPCFHDEPFARLPCWYPAYQEVASILYHSPEEKDFAEVELGLNHPRAVCVGTVLDMTERGDAAGSQDLVGTNRPYIAYCGRYSAHKNVPLLLDYAGRYEKQHPERFKFVFVGQGEITIPREGWARDLGFVDEEAKRDILAGAAALVQLSCYESLSLVALEAWAQGVPVLAHQDCAVLAGHLHRNRAGQVVDGFDCFAAALDDLWKQPERWRELGQRGREYVRAQFGCQASFTNRLVDALRDLGIPLTEHMRCQGLRRAVEHDRSVWRERFGRLVEQVLDAPVQSYREEVEIRPRMDDKTLSNRQEAVLIPVRIANRGSHPLVPDGPGRMILRSFVVDEAGRPCGLETDTRLPELVAPGQEIAAAVRVCVPGEPGVYQVGFATIAASRQPSLTTAHPAAAWLRVTVKENSMSVDGRCCAPLLDNVQAALAEADERQRLPQDYSDVTEGWLAGCKRWLKRKLLGNFKHAYVDVLSRQQSAFNRLVLAAVQELAECCTLLDQSRAGENNEGKRGGEPSVELVAVVRNLQQQLAESRRECAALQERLARLEGIRRQRQP